MAEIRGGSLGKNEGRGSQQRQYRIAPGVAPSVRTLGVFGHRAAASFLELVPKPHGVPRAARPFSQNFRNPKPPPSGLLSRLWPQHFRFRHQHARTQSSAIPVSPKPRDIARPVATSLKPSPALWTSSWAQAHCCFGLGAERTPRVKICSLFFDFQMSYTWDQFLALAPFTPCHGACSVALWLLSEKSHPISKTHQLETWAGDCQMGVIIVPTAG